MGETDEWTLVVHQKHHRPKQKFGRGKKGKRSKNASEITSSRHENSASLVTHDSSNNIDAIDLRRSLATIETFRVRWAESAQGRQLRAIWEKSRYNITTAIVAGLGNLDPGAIRDRFRASWQLAVFLDMVSTLSITSQDQATAPARNLRNEGRPKMFAQDPAFTMFDKHLLSQLDIEVRSNAMEKCETSSLLYVPFVDAVVLLPQILKDRDPELYIGTDIELIIERMSMPMYAAMGDISQELVDESLSIARTFLSGRQRLDVDFNSFDELSLYGLSIYGRKQAKQLEHG